MPTVASDTFTVGADTFLESHTPNQGTAWQVNTTTTLTCLTATNNLQNDATQQHWAREKTSLGDDDMDVIADTTINSTSTSRRAGVTGRCIAGEAGNNNSYQAYRQGEASGTSYQLDKVIGGTRTNLGSYSDAASNATSQTIKLQIRTAAKKVFVDGVERISSADDNLTGNNFAGLYMQERLPRMDNWSSVFVQTLAKSFSVDTLGILTAGLHAYWKLDEASGTRVDSASTNDLTDNNTVTQGAGKVGHSAQFTEANSEFLSIGNTSDLQTGNIDFSIAGWVYLDSKTNLRNFISRDDGGTTVEYRLYYNNSLDRLVLDIFDSGGTRVGRAQADNLGSPSTATWYFIVAWQDAGAASVGIQVNNGTANTAATTGVITAQTLSTTLGARKPTASDSFMDGQEDEFGFWKKVLGTQEKTDLYNAGNGNTLVTPVTHRMFALFD